MKEMDLTKKCESIFSFAIMEINIVQILIMYYNQYVKLCIGEEVRWIKLQY